MALGPLGKDGNIDYHTGGWVQSKTGTKDDLSLLNRVKVSGDKVNLAEFAAPQMDKHILITLHAGE